MLFTLNKKGWECKNLEENRGLIKIQAFGIICQIPVIFYEILSDALSGT